MRISKLGSIGLMLGVLAAASVTPAAAQIQIPSDNTAYGTTSAEFLLFPVHARGAALGNAFAAIASDVSAVHFNPSQLAMIARPSLQASSLSYIAETRYNWVGVGFPIKGGSAAFGLSIGSFGFGDQMVTTVEDPQGESGETYSVSETVIGATYAQRFSDRFAAGFTGKFINDQLGRTSGSAFAVDFGTTFTAEMGGRPLRAAFTVRNLGTNIKHSGTALDVVVRRDPPSGEDDIPQEPAAAELTAKAWQLPVTFNVALAYDAFATSRSRLSLMGEFSQPNNSDPGFNFAGEYNMNLTRSLSLAGRIGYTYAPDNNIDAAPQGSPGYAGFNSNVSEGMDGFSAGGGLRWQTSQNFGLNFDYAYRSLGVLGGTNMISFGLSW
jgi:hypothetical protein